ncbi:MAG: hypothetical protein IJH91_05750 [Mogibacterium sp.]|nr:hypothetical protein [Mogibacterium sp.]
MTDQTLHLENAPKEIAVKWFLLGKRDPDPLMRFLSYWLSFTQLYNYGQTDLSRRTEAERVQAYCKDKLDLLIKVIDFDAPYLDAFKERPVITGTEDFSGTRWLVGNMNRIVIKMAEALGDEPAVAQSQEALRQIAGDYINVSRDPIPASYRTLSLFATMYRIRCNLYHGLPNPDGAHDMALVKSAADVLEQCLPVLLTDTFGLGK